MLHIIQFRHPDPNEPILAAMFEARKRVFVDLLRWDLLVTDDRFEIDQFDSRHAIYLIVTNQVGAHLASARLLPTVRPHILGTLFAELCEDEVPVGPKTFEITRFCLERRIATSVRRAARDTLVAAIADFALAHDIDTYTGVAEIGWLQQILAFGWYCQPLGLPKMIGGLMLGALEIRIDRETPARLAENGIVTNALSALELRHAA